MSIRNLNNRSSSNIMGSLIKDYSNGFYFERLVKGQNVFSSKFIDDSILDNKDFVPVTNYKKIIQRDMYNHLDGDKTNLLHISTLGITKDLGIVGYSSTTDLYPLFLENLEDLYSIEPNRLVQFYKGNTKFPIALDTWQTQIAKGVTPLCEESIVPVSTNKMTQEPAQIFLANLNSDLLYKESSLQTIFNPTDEKDKFTGTIEEKQECIKNKISRIGRVPTNYNNTSLLRYNSNTKRVDQDCVPNQEVVVGRNQVFTLGLFKDNLFTTTSGFLMESFDPAFKDSGVVVPAVEVVKDCLMSILKDLHTVRELKRIFDVEHELVLVNNPFDDSTSKDRDVRYFHNYAHTKTYSIIEFYISVDRCLISPIESLCFEYTNEQEHRVNDILLRVVIVNEISPKCCTTQNNIFDLDELSVSCPIPIGTIIPLGKVYKTKQGSKPFYFDKVRPNSNQEMVYTADKHEGYLRFSNSMFDYDVVPFYPNEEPTSPYKGKNIGVMLNTLFDSKYYDITFAEEVKDVNDIFKLNGKEFHDKILNEVIEFYQDIFNSEHYTNKPTEPTLYYPKI